MALSVLRVQLIYSQNPQHALRQLAFRFSVQNQAHLQGKTLGVLSAEGRNLFKFHACVWRLSTDRANRLIKRNSSDPCSAVNAHMLS